MKQFNDVQIDLPKLPSSFGRWLVTGALGLAVLSFAMSTWYVVPAESEAVKLRFGRIVDSRIQPGLHFKLPMGIESVDMMPVQRQLKMEFGYATPGALDLHQGGRGGQEIVKNMVTGDRNAVHVDWVVQYHIDDLAQHLYHTRDPQETLRDATEAVMREIIGDRTVDEVLTVGRQEIEVEARTKLQEVAKLYELGMMIDQVQLKAINPPPQVRDSFEDVNRAQQERDQMVNMARAEYNKAVPRAKGEADQKLSEAEGDGLKRVNEANGDAGRFAAIYEAYRKAPDVTRRRMYMETMSEVLPKMGRKVILDGSAGNVLPFLPLGGESGGSAPGVRRQP
jgi:membrane protease subunit HflK